MRAGTRTPRADGQRFFSDDLTLTNRQPRSAVAALMSPVPLSMIGYIGVGSLGTRSEIAAELKRPRGEIRAIQRRALRHLQELRTEPRPGVSRLDPRTSDS